VCFGGLKLCSGENNCVSGENNGVIPAQVRKILSKCAKSSTKSPRTAPTLSEGIPRPSLTGKGEEK
jgi:hypothetical protein